MHDGYFQNKTSTDLYSCGTGATPESKRGRRGPDVESRTGECVRSRTTGETLLVRADTGASGGRPRGHQGPLLGQCQTNPGPE